MPVSTLAHKASLRRNQSVFCEVLVRCLQLDSGATECGSSHSGPSCCYPEASARSCKYLWRILQLCTCALQPDAARCQETGHCEGSLWRWLSEESDKGQAMKMSSQRACVRQGCKPCHSSRCYNSRFCMYLLRDFAAAYSGKTRVSNKWWKCTYI